MSLGNLFCAVVAYSRLGAINYNIKMLP
ncbi:Protein of unknown function [Bacillus mobilis]|nr:Protein of unknown function [Bacillus mobilis]